MKPKAGALGSKPGMAARRIAVDVLGHVLEHGRPLDAELDALGATPAYKAMEPRDRGLLRALVGMTLRRLGQIDQALDSLIERSLPAKAERARQILRIGAAQVLFLDVPDHAAVSIAVDLVDEDQRTRHLKALVNGVLRGLIRARDEFLASQDAARLNTVDWLWERWVAAYGEDTTRAIAAAHMVEPTLDLSVKADPARWAHDLGGIVLPTGTVRSQSGGSVDQLPGYVEGAWWVQDAAAALPARLIGDVRGLKVADLCAAPGGKSAALAQAGATVTAVDISAERLKRLIVNMSRLGFTTVTPVAADLLKWTPAEPFDAVLLDAPCSATGTIRRHPDVAQLKRAEDIVALAALQGQLLERVKDWVKPGGTLIYCTCSLEPEEGEQQITRFLDTHPEFRRRPVTAEEIGGLAEAILPSGDVRTLPCHLAHADPRLTGLDGFFISRLTRL